MLVRNILKEQKTTFSFEFFPPKTPEGWDRLFLTISDLIPLKPSWVSVTYGAGGSTREHTHNLVVRIRKETDLTVVTHLTCVEASRGDVAAILERYDSEGIHNILALRGDPPLGQREWKAGPEGFCYATDLVSFIKTRFPHMCVGVAGFPEGHPETRNRLQEIDHLKAKVDAGADYIITQLFFDNRESGVDLIGNPDFVKLAEAYGIPARRVTTRDEVIAAVEWANSITDGPTLIEFVVEKHDIVYPMVPAGADLDKMIRRPMPSPDGI